MYSGMTHLASELNDIMPRATKSSNFWSKLQNPSEDGPIPIEALGLIIVSMAKRKLFWSIIAILFSHDRYLKKSDWEPVAAEDVTVTFGANRELEAASVLGSGARGLSTKTRTNQGVIAGDSLFWRRSPFFLKIHKHAKTILARSGCASQTMVGSLG